MSIKSALMWLPNALTMSRFVGLYFGVYFLVQKEASSAYLGALIFVIVGITDVVDGYLARRMGAISAFGKIMDPIADKAYILSVYFTFVWLDLISVWWVVPIAAREILVTVFRMFLLRKNHVVAAEKSGKLKAMLQNISLVFLFCLYCNLHFWKLENPIGNVAIAFFAYGTLLAAVVLSVYSGIDFLNKNGRALLGLKAKP